MQRIGQRGSLGMYRGGRGGGGGVGNAKEGGEERGTIE